MSCATKTNHVSRLLTNPANSDPASDLPSLAGGTTAPLWPPEHVFTEPLTAAPQRDAATCHPNSTPQPEIPVPAPLEASTAHRRTPTRSVEPESDPQNILREFVKSKQNKNTTKKTDQNVRRFREWMSQEPRNETRDLLDIPPVEMDQYVGGFLLALKKPDLSDYEPDTLTSFHRSINRKLEELGYGFSLVDCKEFKLSKKVLESKRRELKQKGLGNRKHVAEALTENDEETLWETKEFGVETPQSLINTVWYFNAKLFGFRGQQESRQLLWGDIEIKHGENGEEFLEFNERETKTRSGNSTHLRSFAPKIFPVYDRLERCPVSAYKQFREHRPEAMLHPDAPFYLGVIQNPTTKVWYRSQPMGQNLLGSMMKTMASNASLNGKFTNHSVRKTMISQLLHSGVNPTTVVQLSGHKSLQSLQNYHTASYGQQKQMAQILSSNANMPNIMASRAALTHAKVTPATSPGPAGASSPVVDPRRAIVPQHLGQQTQAGGHDVNLSLSRTENSLSGLFAGATFNGTVNIMFK